AGAGAHCRSLGSATRSICEALFSEVPLNSLWGFAPLFGSRRLPRQAVADSRTWGACPIPTHPGFIGSAMTQSFRYAVMKSKHLSLRSSMRLIVATYATALVLAAAGAQTGVPAKE